MEECLPFHRIISEDDRLHGKVSSCSEGGNELSVDVTRVEPSASPRSWYTQSYYPRDLIQTLLAFQGLCVCETLFNMP